MKKVFEKIFIVMMCSLSLAGCGHQHNYGELIPEVLPTCTEDGMAAHYYCEACDKYFDVNKNITTLENLTIEKLGHDDGEQWYEENGYHYHLCNRCGARDQIELHTISEVAEQAAGHEHGGAMHHYECSVCHNKFLDSNGLVSMTHFDTNPTGHDATLTYHPEVPAGCDTNGTKAYYSCSCGQLFADAEGTQKINAPVVIPATGHIHNGVWHHDENHHWHVCHECNEIIDEADHIPGSTVYQDKNYTWKECTVCGQKVDVQEKTPGACAHERVMHYDKVSPTLSKPGHIEYYYCLDCQKSFYDAACTQEIQNAIYGVKDMRDGRYLSPYTGSFKVLNKNLRDYLDAKTDQEIIAALRNNDIKNYQANKTILWEDNNKAPYTIELSETRSFDTYKTYTSNLNVFTFEGTFVPGNTYYYRVKDVAGKYRLNDLSFKVDDSYSLRTVTVDGMHNVRDLGGWTAKDGHKVLYEKLYRGGSLSGITEKGKETLLETLGVKNEIDLRRTEFDGGQDLFDSRLTYNNCGIWMYTQIIPGYSFWSDDDPSIERDYKEYVGPAIKQAMEILADPNNYPVYFHCSAGADRTGTFAYLVNGLLGVEYENLVQDFELTSFSTYGKRYRSAVNDDDTFSSSGIFQNDNNNWVAFGKLNELMNAEYGDDDIPLYHAIETYLKEVCHVSDATIAAVRRNLLGEDVDFSI